MAPWGFLQAAENAALGNGQRHPFSQSGLGPSSSPACIMPQELRVPYTAELSSVPMLLYNLTSFGVYLGPIQTPRACANVGKEGETLEGGGLPTIPS